MIVGYSAGSVYDQYARLIAQFMPRHIPGNPEMIVQNMPGGGSLIAVCGSNHLVLASSLFNHKNSSQWLPAVELVRQRNIIAVNHRPGRKDESQLSRLRKNFTRQ